MSYVWLFSPFFLYLPETTTDDSFISACVTDPRYLTHFTLKAHLKLVFGPLKVFKLISLNIYINKINSSYTHTHYIHIQYINMS